MPLGPVRALLLAVVAALAAPAGGGAAGTDAPETTITSGPAGLTADDDPSFGFAATAPGSTFRCRLDGPSGLDTYAACPTPKAYADLPDGTYALRVFATDTGGARDLTAAVRTFRVDTTAPETAVTTGPSGATNDTSPSFGLAASQGGATFRCRLDTPAGLGTYAGCTSPKSLAGLADGTYHLRVTATDPAGNRDPTAALRVFTVDTKPPETTITSGPSGLTRTNDPTFALASSAAGSTFRCRLDGPAGLGITTDCSSPWTSSDLPDGTYAMYVRAVDRAGNRDLTAAKRTFTVDTTPPETTITGGPAGPTATNDPSFGFASSEPGARFRCRLEGPGGPDAYVPCAAPQAFTDLPDGTYVLRVFAVDAAGNADWTPATRAFTVDTLPPDTGILSGPSSTTTDRDPSFAVIAYRGGVAFRCRLDRPSGPDADAPCPNPRTYAGLADGQHTFRVSAVDAAGNVDPTPATRTFAVVP